MARESQHQEQADLQAAGPTTSPDALRVRIHVNISSGGWMPQAMSRIDQPIALRRPWQEHYHKDTRPPAVSRTGDTRADARVDDDPDIPDMPRYRASHNQRICGARSLPEPTISRVETLRESYPWRISDVPFAKAPRSAMHRLTDPQRHDR